MGMPPLCVGDGDPSEHLGEFAIMPGPEEEVPVIRHQAIGADTNLGLSIGLGENLLKGSIVGRFLKQWESADTPIQDMIGEVFRSEARPARHGGACTETSILLSRKRLPTPFLIFLSPILRFHVGGVYRGVSAVSSEGRGGEERAGPLRTREMVSAQVNASFVP